MVSVLWIIVAHRDSDAIGAHGTVRQGRHQSMEAAEHRMLHEVAHRAIVGHPHGVVMPRYERRHEVLRAGNDG
jgi:hypothetical protein